MGALKKKAPPKKMGRPDKFDPRYIEEARRLTLLGATDREMAEFWKISTGTLHKWKIENSDFLSALNGKLVADSGVSTSLFRRAMGYTDKATKVMMVNGKPKAFEYTEYYPPDVTACIFWLKNRQREKWRDVLRQEQTGADGGAIKTETQQTVILDASKMDPDARGVLRDALKAAKG